MTIALAATGVVLLVALHGGLIAFLVLGAPLTLRWPGLTWPHLAAIAAVAVVFLAGADCPFTTWENELRDAAGWATYERGFVVHYLIEPFYAGPKSAVLDAVIISAWLGPTVAAYAVRSANAHRGHALRH